MSDNVWYHQLPCWGNPEACITVYPHFVFSDIKEAALSVYKNAVHNSDFDEGDFEHSETFLIKKEKHMPWQKVTVSVNYEVKVHEND